MTFDFSTVTQCIDICRAGFQQAVSNNAAIGCYSQGMRQIDTGRTPTVETTISAAIVSSVLRLISLPFSCLLIAVTKGPKCNLAP